MVLRYDSGHHDHLGKQAVRFRDLGKDRGLLSAAGLSVDRNIFRISSKSGYVFPDPAKGLHDIRDTCIRGIPVFLPESGKVQMSESIQPMVERYENHIVPAGQIESVIAFLLNR